MKAKLDREGCIACELCAELCPDVFRMAEDGIAEVWQEKVPAPLVEDAEKAQASCPVSVISVE